VKKLVDVDFVISIKKYAKVEKKRKKHFYNIDI